MYREYVHSGRGPAGRSKIDRSAALFRGFADEFPLQICTRTGLPPSTCHRVLTARQTVRGRVRMAGTGTGDKTHDAVSPLGASRAGELCRRLIPGPCQARKLCDLQSPQDGLGR